MEEELCYGGNNNWDLGAVVRLGCCRRRISPASASDPFASFLLPPVMEVSTEKEMAGVDAAGWSFPELSAGDGAGLGRDADELLKAFCAAFPSSSPPPLTEQPKEEQKPLVVPENLPVQTAASASAPARSPAAAAVRQVAGGVPRSKRRKNQQKKVVRHVPADGVSADVWAWRKYGQKPIKGSPYPRGYYRCSSSKGCPARKQVERSRADPNTFILTYTGEHNHSAPTHRNSLAGTTRNKLSPSSSSASVSATAAAAQPQQPPPSVVVAGAADAAAAAAGLSPTTPLRTPSMEEDEDEDVDDELLVEDMEMAGEDELLFLNGGGGDGDTTAVSSLFDIDEPAFLPSPWTEQAAGS